MRIRRGAALLLAVGVWAGPGAAPSAAAGPAIWNAASPAPAQQDTVRFRHEDHAELDCVACHATGRPTVRTEQAWCAECHHEGPGFARCGDCHPARALARAYDVSQILRTAAGGLQPRSLPFSHPRHASVECRACHRTGAMPRADRPCADCHAEHHRPEADCMACHRAPPPDAHAVEVHLQGCGGSGCHGEAAEGIEALGRTRSVCLSCHQTERDHEPGESCVRCHVLSPPGRAPGSGAGRDGGR